MPKYNSYETKTLGVYGNPHETIFVNKNGKAFIVQSPDMRPGSPTTGRGLSPNPCGRGSHVEPRSE